MPTLERAASQLNISEKTLRRWIKLLNAKNPEQPIETPRHEWDLRHRVISESDLKRITDARSQMPGYTGTVVYPPPYGALGWGAAPPYSVPQAWGAPDDTTAHSGHGVAAQPRERTSPTPPQGDAALGHGSARRARRVPGPSEGQPLPDGMMSRTDVADLHNFPRSTLRRWCEEGRVETVNQSFGGEHGTFAVHQPVTATGVRQFYLLASGRADFQRCDACPHDGVLGGNEWVDASPSIDGPHAGYAAPDTPDRLDGGGEA